MTNRKHARPGSPVWAMLGRLKHMSADERAIFMEEAARVTKAIEEKAERPWPRIVKLYLNQSKEEGYQDGLTVGLDMEEMGSWCPLYEVELTVEVQESGDIKILAFDGFMIDYDRPFTGDLYEPEKS